MALQGGVLIIGSLLWDQDNERQQWRQRLREADEKPVPAPIRYGRFSSKTKPGTYTMVFSRLCYRHKQLGQGVVVPFRRPIESFDGLREEAECLAAAEGLNNKSEWGAVGLLCREPAKLPAPFLQQWTEYFTARFVGYQAFDGHTPSEGPVITRGGFLKLRWPLSGKDNKQYDVLLATPTNAEVQGQPNLRRYPLPREIASSIPTDKRNYFVTNVRKGIRTSQDSAIWKTVRRLDPDFAAERSDVSSALADGR